MSLNPIQFGKDVIDQYGRYLQTNFRLADTELRAQMEEGLRFEPGGAQRLAKGPYVFLSRPFVQGPGIAELAKDPELDLHPALQSIFPFPSLHKHQERTLRSAEAGRNVLVATGTGSGKTEAFLLPVLNHALKARDAGAPSGVTALLIYPMNALVNDQLDRLRMLLAGSGVTFGRYTGETPEEAVSNRLERSRGYTPDELELAASRRSELPLPWEERYSRREIREKPPRLLLTNYAQLELLLLRNKDLSLFRGAPLEFFVLDEVHSYTGGLGSEVACLLRRLRAVAAKSVGDITCIGSSATVTDREAGSGADAALSAFASRLFGVAPESVDLVKEEYQRTQPTGGNRYVPPPPPDPQGLLSRVLDGVRDSVLADEVTEVPEEVIGLAEELCGRAAPAGGGSLSRLAGLLAGSRITETLLQSLTSPTTLEELFPRLRAISGRQQLSDEALEAEALAYLTLGALAREGDEPLLRPKLHYLIQGLHGLWLEFEVDGSASVQRRLHFSEHVEEGELRLPLSICRACGQHYVIGAAHPVEAVDSGGEVTGVQVLDALASRAEVDADDVRERFYLTDTLVGGGGEETVGTGHSQHLCSACGALHESPGSQCLNGRCRRKRELVPMLRFPHPVTACPACDASSTERSPVITQVRSSEVYDVMVLAQTALSSMPEPDLRKLLIFTDSRQDAAFQAGWMESRSLRFRLRHLMYQVLEEGSDRWWYFNELQEEVVSQATDEGMIPRKGQAREPEIRRLTWLLLEEFFTLTQRQRRSSLEQLGLVQVRYEGLDGDRPDAFTRRWTTRLGTDKEGVLDTVFVILDTIRLRQAASHRLLQRHWTDWDREVRDGTISVAEYYRPKVILEGPLTDANRRYGIGFRSVRRNQSSFERIVRAAVPQARPEDQDEFLRDLWNFLIEEELLVPATLKQRRQGTVQTIAGLGGGRQVNLDLIQFRLTSGRVVCSHCGKARARALPSQTCPEYNCTGTTEALPRDEEHYDVVQYTKMDFVPLLAREHSAQVPQGEREKVEQEFKKPQGRHNCLVATPTLELGVDIGPLEMVLMRNVPPSPANYSQRAGRAGRRHRIGAVFSYCRDVQHDQYFYRDPPEMISGQVRIPGFSMRNEPLIRKHVHSAVVTELRSDPEAKDVLAEAFPTYISSYFGEEPEAGGRRRIRDRPPDLGAFRRLIRTRQGELFSMLDRTFAEQWPGEDREAVSDARLKEFLESTADDLDDAVRSLLAEIQAYQQILARFRWIEDAGEELTEEERRRERSYKNARQRMWGRDQENYTISYLARRGYFPGYALVRDSVRAFNAEPHLELNRPNAVAIRELTPAARLYANRQQFRVRRLDFYRLEARRPGFDPQELIEAMVWDQANDRLVTSGAAMEGGEQPGIPFQSIRLVDVELDGLGSISDQQEYRFRVGYNQLATQLEEHLGGESGTVGTVPFARLEGAVLRLVNLGPRSARTAAPDGVGYPICTVCGEARSPFASPAEISDFSDRHHERCHVPTGWMALHVDVRSELLKLGPFPDDAGAINAATALQVGLVKVLETGDQDLEVETLRTSENREIAVLFDPMPGGSGLLPLLKEHWSEVIEAGREVLNRCDCDVACYRCLLHFRNQHHHGVLNRHLALNSLTDIDGGFHAEHRIPPTFVQETDQSGFRESQGEDLFAELLRRKSFTPPEEAQYRVELGGGDSTVADFAYPSKRVLVFVDGLSRPLHGNPEQQRRDRIKRAKARAAGWKVAEVSYQGLKDSTVAAGFLDELAVYLDEEPA